MSLPLSIVAVTLSCQASSFRRVGNEIKCHFLFFLFAQEGAALQAERITGGFSRSLNKGSSDR